MVRLQVEDLARGRIHQRADRIGGDGVVALKTDARDDRVLDDAERDRDAVGALLDHGRRLIGEIAEIVDRAQIVGNDGRIERFADLRFHDGQNTIRCDVRVTGDRHVDEFAQGGADLRGMSPRPFEPEHMAAIRSISEEKRYPAGTLVTSVGQRADRFLLATEGEIEVVDPFTGAPLPPTSVTAPCAIYEFWNPLVSTHGNNQ